jgi:hypothetical protein
MTDKNDHITLWILNQDRQRNGAQRQKEQEVKAKANLGGNYHCRECKRSFAEPKFIQYYGCPHCESKLEIEQEGRKSCHYWFGFLSQKEKGDPLPSNCVECDKVMECMLNQYYDSSEAVSEIKKWY